MIGPKAYIKMKRIPLLVMTVLLLVPSGCLYTTPFESNHLCRPLDTCPIPFDRKCDPAVCNPVESSGFHPVANPQYCHDCGESGCTAGDCGPCLDPDQTTCP